MSVDKSIFSFIYANKPKEASDLDLEGELLKERLASRVPINPLVRELDKTLRNKGFVEESVISAYQKAVKDQNQVFVNDLKQTAQNILEKKAAVRKILPVFAGRAIDHRFYLSIKQLGEGTNHRVALAMTQAGDLVAASSLKQRGKKDEVKYYSALKGCPNIIQLIQEGESCCFFELARCNLHELLANTFHKEDLFPIMLGILDGGIQMAERGVIHLDLKLDNILIGHDGIPKIADFEFALFADPETGYATEKLKLANIEYYSPERRAKVATPDLTDEPVSVQDNVWGFMHLLCKIALKQSNASSMQLSAAFAKRFNFYCKEKMSEIEESTSKSEKGGTFGYHKKFHGLMHQWLMAEWKDNLFAGLIPETPLDFIVMKMAMFDPQERIGIKEVRDLMLEAKKDPHPIMQLIVKEQVKELEKRLKIIQKEKQDLEKVKGDLEGSLNSQELTEKESIRKCIQKLEKQLSKILQKEKSLITQLAQKA